MIGWTRDALLHSDSTPFTFPEDIGITEVTNQRLTSDQVKQARFVKCYLQSTCRHDTMTAQLTVNEVSGERHGGWRRH